MYVCVLVCISSYICMFVCRVFANMHVYCVFLFNERKKLGGRHVKRMMYIYIWKRGRFEMWRGSSKIYDTGFRCICILQPKVYLFIRLNVQMESKNYKYFRKLSKIQRETFRNRPQKYFRSSTYKASRRKRRRKFKKELFEYLMIGWVSQKE